MGASYTSAEGRVDQRERRRVTGVEAASDTGETDVTGGIARNLFVRFGVACARPTGLDGRESRRPGAVDRS
jgi:isopentenyl phosphate kinase